MSTGQRFALIVTGVAMFHYVLQWACFLAGFSLAMSDFDNGPTMRGALGKVMVSAAELLWWPLVTHAMGRDMSPIHQHVVFAANSMCWGILGAVAKAVCDARKPRAT
jgi:hypothetical protein